jgi:hypothetical protein
MLAGRADIAITFPQKPDSADNPDIVDERFASDVIEGGADSGKNI